MSRGSEDTGALLQLLRRRGSAGLVRGRQGRLRPSTDFEGSLVSSLLLRRPGLAEMELLRYPQTSFLFRLLGSLGFEWMDE